MIIKVKVPTLPKEQKTYSKSNTKSITKDEEYVFDNNILLHKNSLYSFKDNRIFLNFLPQEEMKISVEQILQINGLSKYSDNFKLWFFLNFGIQEKIEEFYLRSQNSNFLENLSKFLKINLNINQKKSFPFDFKSYTDLYNEDSETYFLLNINEEKYQYEMDFKTNEFILKKQNGIPLIKNHKFNLTQYFDSFGKLTFNEELLWKIKLTAYLSKTNTIHVYARKTTHGELISNNFEELKLNHNIFHKTVTLTEEDKKQCFVFLSNSLTFFKTYRTFSPTMEDKDKKLFLTWYKRYINSLK
ncbi:MAG: hypothetical protein ACRC4M_04935 [Mycoplasma sp.]